MSNPKPKSSSKKTARKKRTPIGKWIVIFIVVLITAGLFYFINYGKTKSDSAQEQTLQTTENSAALERANMLTGEVFRYVELVEMKKMTQEEADKLSEPVKVELQQLRAQLTARQIAENDSVRKALGDIMVANVMKWRRENLPPETQ